MSKTENTLHKKTPSVTVLSNRGQVVRDIVYHRHPDTPEKTDERITYHQFDKRGFLEKSADPRMQASGLSNFRYVTSLSGQVLCTESADAGISLTLNDAAGRLMISISQICTDKGQDNCSKAVTQTFRYEGADSAGRLLSITEQTAGQNAQVTERFMYAGNSEAEKAKNLAGICTHHYDPAGLMQTDSIALTGVPLSITRQLLKDADKPVSWPESNPQTLLSAEKYTTQTIADATGAVLNTTDAAGHQQKVTYDIAGLLRTSRVTVKGGTEKIIIKSVTYSAAGQKLCEEHGNGVVTTYTYEPQTQRLIAVKTEHPARKKIFQDLRYEYDPVGNVLCVTNSAEETRFWHNQKVVPENRYTYDTLYQLVSATGREMANAGQQRSSLPDISPFDKASYTNYTRNYIYDRAGNMTQIRHSAPATNNNYTTDITVSQRSNRAVLKTLADTPEKAEALFTPGGQQTQLQPGQTLSWTARGELQQVTPVVRNGAAGDRESYRYDAGSQRILKTTVQKTGNSSLTQQVIYLPGLELYRGKENYQVICAGVAGRAQVRLLHWQDGKKDHQRFSYDNLIGSSGLETDGDGNLLSQEEYYPFGGTAVLVAGTDSGIDYKTHRYSGKERDATGLYYYGYRYYQPWAGRWLSSDPAGTVDGLNLFRMVRNNPVTLRDDDGRKPISENFSEEKGDMVYGLAGFRGKYISSALGRPFLPDSKDAPASIIDLYNNTVSGQVLMSVDMKILQNFMKSPDKYEKKLSPPADIKDRVQKSRAYPLWDSYFSAGEKNEKFNIHSVYKEVRKNPGSTQYHEWHMSGAQSVPKLLWKRGSKLGIEIAASGGGNKIHFALDNLNIKEIISKSGMGGQSITASELRYAYRNRERLGGNIHFYKDDNEVDAPWVSNPEQWNTYKPKLLSVSGGQLVRRHTGFMGRLRASFSRTFRRN
ncbi:RHS repeat-associated core domain-containing protein [Morganella morganii]|uniref:RHS repeat-associated core domain-containing protein n=1 Tax=Morganella morganii TaxID=582 RepID=UPI00076AED42|nr:RHS repeat-associated core domain-containing protein [Morganella morganii]MDK3101729.1 RHS repeat-associated core domain-containing protein [Morganella morganii]MDO7859707.1 RHS repeat-associated core domain-containing protein [Morganella morganii]WPU19641.1 RHS repeat-associated core domain-containing protein [Morganella morganii]SQL17167.1 Cell wall-associated polypeptide CWBP200 [Morganella morganii]